MEKLIVKYLTNNATHFEIQKLEKWIESKENEELFKEYVRINFSINSQSTPPNFLKNKEKLLEHTKKKKAAFPLYRLRLVLKYAAIFVGLIILTVFAYNDFFKGSPVIQNYETNNDRPKLLIGDEYIVLKNEKGEAQIVDEKSKSGIIYNTDGKQIAQQQGNQIDYNIHRHTTKELLYNEMIVPYGKRFQVTLSDGTQVYLNSGTSFKFPVNFIMGKERRVFLNGEAFFEVTKNSKAVFVINSGDANIKVLGTKFNVSSYQAENTNTVLVEGSVQVSGLIKNESGVVLKPGQMATLDHQEKYINVKKVNVNLHTAWMEGKLILRKTPFKIIRKELERYYNVSIINNNPELDEKSYNVNFNNETIEQVLKVLNENYNIDYEITDNKIIIN